MNIDEVEQLAEVNANKYNPTGLSPFPFDEIKRDHPDLIISSSEKLPDKVSGAISYSGGSGERKNFFLIIINSNKPANRQYFTTAHELGHFFLHQKEIKAEEVLVDQDNILENISTLFRIDEATSTKLEIEANRFGASLIMPRDLVIRAWSELKNVEECAKVFNVSVSAMSIRLEKLNLVT